MILKCSKPYKRVIQLELNEISKPVIDQLCHDQQLPGFNQLTKKFSYIETYSEENYHELEPWIQWVTAHTGEPLYEHGVFHLSDAQRIQHPQIWETLSRHDIQSAIIGSMNAIKGTALDGIFFPDPWSKVAKASPETFSKLWQLIAHQVQKHAVSQLSIKELIQGMKTLLQLNMPVKLYASIIHQLARQKLDKLAKWRLAGIFDEFLFELFMKVLGKTQFGFYTLFLNSIAHYQHHFWRNFQKDLFNQNIDSIECHDNDNPMLYGYHKYDRILSEILKRYQGDPETLIIVLSGLSQIPYTEKEDKGGMNYYRLKNHQQFLEKIGLNGFKCFPLMSRDWQLKHADKTQLQHAHKVLTALCVEGEPLFNVSYNSANTLFIETAITRGIDKNAKIVLLDKAQQILFHEAFVRTAIKSGHHTGTGHLWLSDNRLTSQQPIFLGEVYHIGLQALGVAAKQ